MRILSWNINGIRTLPQYHPWNTFKQCEGILDNIDADIICFQEMKSSRQVLSRDVALPPSYHSFFSFPVKKGGYSGVAVYTKSSAVTPLKAEEGLTGRLQPKPPLAAEERISSSYPTIDDINPYSDEHSDKPATLDLLDAEGRGLVLDFGLFVLINVYCPNETSDARLSFKMNYHHLLAERVRRFIEAGREVIVLGDINVCATPLDHCDGHLPSNANIFWEHPARAWFHKWIHPNGPMVDVVRTYWPERSGMFTCWNQKIQARESNYGTRIDYILVTQGLLEWIKHGDIQPSLKGSDHCPIFIDLHDEITTDSGQTIKLSEAMQQSAEILDPPRIAAKCWDEFSNKQTKLSAFFGKKIPVANDPTNNTPPVASSLSAQNSTSSSQERVSIKPKKLSPLVRKKALVAKRPASDPPTASSPPPAESSTSLAQEQADAEPEKDVVAPSEPAPPKKRRLPSSWTDGSSSSAKKKPKKTSSSTSSNRKRAQKAKAHSPPPTASTSQATGAADVDSEPAPAPPVPSDSTGDQETAEEGQMDTDYRLACELAALDESSVVPSPSPPRPSSSQSKAAWSILFTPIEAPKCTVHGEPTKKFTVNKAGPNKGRPFYVCSLPVGPGYDRGRAERLREEVDHQYRCNFFKWASEVKREPGSSKGT